MHRGMTFNLKKDRPEPVKLSELVWFATQGGLDVIGMNEAYRSVTTIRRAANILGWEYFHPTASKGQNWNAVMWDPAKARCLNKRAVLLAHDGYQDTAPRWATRVILEWLDGTEQGERHIWYQMHLPPSIERRGAALITRDRWQNLVESDKRLLEDVLNQRRRHPLCHISVAGDMNVTAMNRRSKYFPSRWMGDRMRLKSLWGHGAWANVKGTFGHRLIDDFRTSRHVRVTHVFQLTAHERSDHNPPIFDFSYSRRLRAHL